MRIILTIAVMALLVPLPAWAIGEWFAIIMVNDEVVVGQGESIDACVKRQLEIEKKEKEFPGIKVRCSRMMTQKVRSISKDQTLDRTYQFSWMGDFATFHEATSLAQCKNEKANLAKFTVDLDFFCAQSSQLIK